MADDVFLWCAKCGKSFQKNAGISACPGCGGPFVSAVTCPFCRTTISSDAVRCPHCQEIIADIPFHESLELMGRLAEVRAMPHPVVPKPFLLSAATIILFALWLLLVGLCVPGMTADHDAEIAVVFAVVATVCLLPGAIALLVRDLRDRALSTCDTPEKAVRSFFRRIKRGHFKHSYNLLSPASRTGEMVPYPEIPELEVSGDPRTFAESKGFAKYWKACTRSSFSSFQNRRITKISFLESESGEADTFGCIVCIEIEVYPMWTVLTVFLCLGLAVILYYVMRKNAKVHINATVYRQNGRWWIYGGSLANATTYNPLQ